MKLAHVFKSALMGAAILAAGGMARAGCNCNTPPAPAMFPSSAYSSPSSGQGYSPMVQPAFPADGVPMNASPVPATGMPYGGVVATNGPHWAPGGYEARVGSPTFYYDPAGGQYVVTGDPYYDHFGPGFHRSSIHGHYSFPYYNYRSPWYYPGRAVYNRNTNFAW